MELCQATLESLLLAHSPPPIPHLLPPLINSSSSSSFRLLPRSGEEKEEISIQTLLQNNGSTSTPPFMTPIFTAPEIEHSKLRIRSGGDGGGGWFDEDLCRRVLRDILRALHALHRF